MAADRADPAGEPLPPPELPELQVTALQRLAVLVDQVRRGNLHAASLVAISAVWSTG